MSENKRHSGGCHCGKVRFEAEIGFEKVMTCNCSICQKRGTWLTMVDGSKFNLISGADAQTLYRFHKNVIDHLFCATCGVASYAMGKSPDGAAVVAVNVRCLDDVDLSAITPMHIDGKSF